MMTAYRCLGMVQGVTSGPRNINAVAQMPAQDRTRLGDLAFSILPALGMHPTNAPTVQGWLMHNGNPQWLTSTQLSARMKQSLSLATSVAATLDINEAYTRLIGARAYSNLNAHSLLLNSDPISAIASIIMALEFQSV